MTLASAILDRLPPQLAIPLLARFGHQDPEVAFLRNFVKLGDTVLDVGAHKGAYTWHLARLVGASGRVHAFEPQPHLASRLSRGAARQVVVHPFALSDSKHVDRLVTPIWGDTHMYGHATLEDLPDDTAVETVEIKAITLDSLDLNPTFAKIDIEGHEVAMLRGSEDTMSRGRPVLLVEIDWRHQLETKRRAELISWLICHDYRVHYVIGHDLSEPVELSADTDPNSKIDNSPYIFNWFMIPAQ
jgi:FkbM family methyltransferase